MNYSEKLKDARWLDFRSAFIRSRSAEWHNDWCDECGENSRGSLHVHHKIYRDGKEPWEYEFDDLRLLCEDCHDHIHETEDRARVLIRSLPAHICDEFSDLLGALEECASTNQHILKVALAHAKNTVRNVYHAEREPGGITSHIRTFRELAQDYLDQTKA